MGTGSKLNTAPGVTPASTTSPGVIEKAKGAATSAFTASSTPTQSGANVVAESVIPNSQAGASASGAQTPGSDQLMGTVLLQNKAGTASATVGPNTPTSAFVGNGSKPMTPPVATLVSTPPAPAAVTSSTLTTRSATATSTTKTTTQSDGKTVSPRRAKPTEDQDTKAAGHQKPASAFTPITADQTAAVPEPSTREAPSASLILETALASCQLVTPIEEKLLADQTSHGTTENFQKMVIDLIIIYRLDALVDPKYLSKDSPLSEKETQERSDLELAKKLQQGEFDTYYRNHR